MPVLFLSRACICARACVSYTTRTLSTTAFPGLESNRQIPIVEWTLADIMEACGACVKLSKAGVLGMRIDPHWRFSGVLGPESPLTSFVIVVDAEEGHVCAVAPSIQV